MCRRSTALRASLWYLPGLLALMLVACTAAGIRVISPATAAPVSAGQTIIVGGAVDKEVHLTTACPAGSLTIDSLVPGDPAREASTNCVVTFGSNNSVLGADLTVEDASALSDPGRDAMVCVAASCGAPGSPATLGDFQGSPMPTGVSSFGMRLDGASGPAMPVWTVNAGPAPTGQYYDAADTPDVACQTATDTDGDCEIRFAAASAAVQDPGAYQAQIRFAVQAR